jgi:hypothetical protein
MATAAAPSRPATPETANFVAPLVFDGDGEDAGAVPLVIGMVIEPFMGMVIEPDAVAGAADEIGDAAVTPTAW